MAQFRKKSAVVEAFRLPEVGDDDTEAFHAWAERVDLTFTSDRDEGIEIEDGLGFNLKRVDPGDWIVKELTGEFSAWKADIFATAYEAI